LVYGDDWNGGNRCRKTLMILVVKTSIKLVLL